MAAEKITIRSFCRRCFSKFRQQSNGPRKTPDQNYVIVECFFDTNNREMQQKPRPELLMRFCKGRLRFMVENKVLLHKLLCNNVSLHAYMCLCAQYAFEMGGDCLHRTQAAMLSFCLCGKYRDFFKPFKKHITCLIRSTTF